MVAYWINVLSVIGGAFSILFLFWSITLLGRKVYGFNKLSEVTEDQKHSFSWVPAWLVHLPILSPIHFGFRLLKPKCILCRRSSLHWWCGMILKVGTFIEKRNRQTKLRPIDGPHTFFFYMIGFVDRIPLAKPCCRCRHWALFTISKNIKALPGELLQTLAISGAACFFSSTTSSIPGLPWYRRWLRSFLRETIFTFRLDRERLMFVFNPRRRNWLFAIRV